MLPLPPEYTLATGAAPLPPRRNTVEIPVFWIVLLLSALVHLAVLVFVPPLRLEIRPGVDPDAPLAVELQPPRRAPEAPAAVPKPKPAPPVAVAPRPTPPPPKPPRAEAAPARKPAARPAEAAPRPAPAEKPAPALPSAPPVIASTPPAEETRPAPAPERAASPPAGDLASYIEARRRARGASAAAPAPPSAAPSPPPDDEARRNQIVARNLGLNRAPVFGGPPRQGGGVFQITRLHYGNAEFAFFGWNKDIRRNTSQLIEVRKGEHPSIEIAVIRRMIAIIREHESGDFVWESDRLGRDVMLSARPADNAGLEEFLMREFFGDTRRDIGAVGQAPR